MRLLKLSVLVVVALNVFIGVGLCDNLFVDYCTNTYQSKNNCPDATCLLQCADGSQIPNCPLACVPRDCKTISVESCPKDFCSVVVDCSEQKNCLPKISEYQVPTCGALAYSAQDVNCCKGLVKRCGFDYLDGSCNMKGNGTSYSFPICIPCGDGVCTNFENHCNCPEDCPKEIIPLN